MLLARNKEVSQNVWLDLFFLNFIHSLGPHQIIEYTSMTISKCSCVLFSIPIVLGNHNHVQFEGGVFFLQDRKFQ